MAKSQKYNSKRGQAPPHRNLIPLLLALGGAILIIVTLLLVFQPPKTPTTSEVTGTARLKADKQKIDLGDVKLGTTVRASFQLANVGDQPLRITKAPYVELKEGC